MRYFANVTNKIKNYTAMGNSDVEPTAVLIESNQVLCFTGAAPCFFKALAVVALMATSQHQL